MEDHQTKFDALVQDYPLEVQDTLRRLHEIIQIAGPGLTPQLDVNDGNIVYHYNGNVLAVTPEDRRVRVFFYDAAQLEDARELLEGEDESYVIIEHAADLDRDAFSALVRQAYALH